MNKKIIIGLMALASMTLVLAQGANAATTKKPAPSKVQVQQSKNGVKAVENKKTTEVKKAAEAKKAEQKPKMGSGERPRIGSGERPEIGSGDREHIGSGQKLGSGDKADMKLELKPLKELIQKIDEILQKSRVQAIKEALSIAKKALQSQIPAPTTGTVAK